MKLSSKCNEEIARELAKSYKTYLRNKVVKKKKQPKNLLYAMLLDLEYTDYEY